MLLTEEQAERRMKDPANLAVRFADNTQFNVKKRTPRGPRIPEGVRAEIATDVLLGLGTQEEIANDYGVSTGTVVEAKKQYAATTAGKEVIDAAADRAFDRLMATLGFMTDDKLSGLSAKDLSVVAANMSRVVEKTRAPKEDERTKLIVYAPQLKTEEQYVVIDIK